MYVKKVLLYFSLSILFAAGGWLIMQYSNQEERNISKIENNLQYVLKDVEREANIILNNPSSVEWTALKNSFFLIDTTQVVAWSQHQFFPDIRQFNETNDFILSQTSAGYFLIRSWPVERSKYLLSVTPLIRKYSISNKYLSDEWNERIFQFTNVSILEANSVSGFAISWNDQILFKIQSESIFVNGGYMALLFILASLLLTIFAIKYSIKVLTMHRHFEIAFFVLLFFILLLRAVMIFADVPAKWFTGSVFDPQYFASSSYNASIGDLFINSCCILILCLFVFTTYTKWKSIKWILTQRNSISILIALLFTIAALFSFLYPYLFIETISHNSSISLDITDTVQFDRLRWLSWLSVLTGSVSAFLFMHVFVQLARKLCKSNIQIVSVLVGTASVFLFYMITSGHNYVITLSVGVLFLVLLFVTPLTGSLRNFSFNAFVYFFVFVAAFGIQHGLSIKQFADEKRAKSQLKFASNYLVGRDVLGEYLLNESVKRIKKDAFIQSRLLNPFVSKSAVRQKIRKVYLNAYFNRYEATIHLYNSAGEAYEATSRETLAVLSDQIGTSSNKTEYEGIYFIKSGNSEFGKRYISIIPIHRLDILVGFIVIDLSLKRVIPENVYPELLVDRRFAGYYENQKRSFAFINGNKVLTNFGEYNYEHDFNFQLIERNELFNEGINDAGFFHTAVEDSAGQVVVISSPQYVWFYVFTNFSFFFVSGVLLLVVLISMYGIFSVYKGYKINYTTRIQLYIYLAFSLPLLVAVITTLNRVTRSAEDKIKSDFEGKAIKMGEGLTSSVVEFVNDSLDRNEFENALIDLAKVSNIDIAFYDKFGKHVASSQPLIIESQVTSGLMNRVAFERITEESMASTVVGETIGSLNFNNCYVSIKKPESGAVIGILSVPFFDFANSLEDTQITVLANFLTIFTAIFIAFSILSYYVVNALTSPLRYITRALSRTTLSGANKPLEWKSNDEIGMMVSEYNKMVENLEQSKLDLARSQKETAWREIAKQVAHEIKNPLTPMKLTLQQMEYQLLSNKLDDEKTRTSITMLLTQVDILNDIASSFSAFARMPAPILAPVNLHELLKRCVALFTDAEEGNVTLATTIEHAIISGDAQLLNRIFSNIILNGLQSGEPGGVVVTVHLTRNQDEYLVAVRDNGKGIDPALVEKIFIPHFSTKKTGSGLGLAISRQGIEQSGGKIWFETGDSGTTFYVSLPAAEN